ncbi:MAG: hypothetical protein ACI9QC_000808 [Oceanicoccus sp.]|jgi:hypothetical protein
MAESGPKTPEVAEVATVDTERVQFATMLAPFINDALTSDTPVDELKARLRIALGGADGERELVAADGERELVAVLREEGVGSEQEVLDERLKQQLTEMKEDFDERGIVLIEVNATPDQLIEAFIADKTAGKEWEVDIKSRLLADDATLLKKAAAMPKGGQLIGVYSNGELAIRQRSQEIVNARWTIDWQDGQSSDRGELRLLPHAEAIAQEEGRWAKAVEILCAVKAAGYHVPADAPNYEKGGLVAASEVVTGGHYVMSPDGEEWRDAILECADNEDDSSYVRVVFFVPYVHVTSVGAGVADGRRDSRGAVLWLRG